MRPLTSKLLQLCALAALAVMTPLAATENGTQQYPIGVNSLVDGFVPAPGTFQFYDYMQYNHASHQNDADGHRSNVPFNLDAAANAFRVMYTWTPQLGPFHYTSGVVLPIVSVHLNVAGLHGNDTGAGNIDIQNYLGGSNSSHTFFYFFGLDTYVPSGHYDRSALINVGANYYTFDPNFNMSWVPNQKWDISAVLFTEFSTTNHATGYHSGDWVDVDFGVTYRPFSRLPHLGFGVQGYLYKQFSNDTRDGLKVGTDGYRGQVISVGPMIRYDIDHGGFALKWQPEFAVRNRPVGNAVWFQFSLPLSGHG